MTDPTVTVTLPMSVWVEVHEMLDTDAHSDFYRDFPELIAKLKLACAAIDAAVNLHENGDQS